MTGGTSGLGHPAAQRIAVAPDARLILGARHRNAGQGESLPLDLASLTSARAFASAVQESLAHGATIIITTSDPAELAQRDDVMNDLWQRRAHMVGLADQR